MCCAGHLTLPALPGAVGCEILTAMQIRYIDGPRLRRSLIAACDHAQRQRGELNRINVFPVPDGDTGTNLALTVRAISDGLRPNRDRAVSDVAAVAAQSAIMGARGNCGMILSHFLLGFSDHVKEMDRLTGPQFSDAMGAGVKNLYAALERPVEGTILTVMRETAEAAERSVLPDFVPLINSLVTKAQESLARTPDLLPVLKAAGVVDAGAKGFVSLLEGVLLFINGDPIIAVEEGDMGGGAAAIDYPDQDEVYRFCTEALVRGDSLPDQTTAEAMLREYGDSLIVIRSEDILKIHIHTDEPEEVFGLLRGIGDLVTHKAEDMRVQHEALERSSKGHVRLARRPITIVTDSASDLPEEIVRAHGIKITPMALIDGDKTLRDRFDVSAEEFQRRLLEEPDTLPTTSQPTPADFLASYTEAAEEGEEIVCVILGSSLSGALSSAQAASRRFHGAPVHLFDSRGASLLQGLLALKASELAELGMPADEIISELERIRSRSGILITVDKFDRLLKSGRVGRGRALLGSMLNVKPVLALSQDGHLEPAGKAIGRNRVVTALLDAMYERIPPDATKLRFGVVHVGYPEVVSRVSDLLRERYGPVEILSAPATPVISTHVGIGAWGLAWMAED